MAEGFVGAGGDVPRNRISGAVRKLFPDDFDEIKPGKRPVWDKIDFDYMMSGWRIWMLLLVVGVVSLQGILVYNHVVNIQCDLITWAHQVEVTLQRRKDIVKNLTATVVSYTNHESQLFGFVSSKRNEMKAPSQSQIADLAKQSSAIGDLSQLDGKKLENFAGSLKLMAENYPQLRASENYQLLMDEMMVITTDLEELRKSYNKSLAVYETYLRAFPNCLYNWIFRYRHYDYIQVDKEVGVVLPFETGVDQAVN